VSNAVTITTTISGNNTITIPAGVTTLNVIGRGGSGTSTTTGQQGNPAYPSGLPPYRAPSGYVAGTPPTYSWGSGVSSGQGTLRFDSNGGQTPAVDAKFSPPSGSPSGAGITYLYYAYVSGYQDTSGGPGNYTTVNTYNITTYTSVQTSSGTAGYYTDPGAGLAAYPSGLPPYSAGTTTTTTGTASTFTINGETYTYPGGNGGAATPITTVITLTGTAPVTASYSIASGVTSTVYYFDVGSAGTQGVVLPGPLSHSQALITNDRLYLFGGINTNTSSSTSIVYMTKINEVFVGLLK
jgi:hypothetical protein